MIESSEQRAPELGAPTDALVGEAAVNAGAEPDETDAATTMDTPDELGGTGGKQAGGAG
jgi:hypothetical protein